MSSFICSKCHKLIMNSQIGYVTGCEHYPLRIKMSKICKICKNNWNGRCIYGLNDLIENKDSIIHIEGCKYFKLKE